MRIEAGDSVTEQSLVLERPEPEAERSTPPLRGRAQSQDSEMFRLLVSQVVDYAIFLIDPEGFVTSWNEGAERIKGYSEAEIVGQHFSVFYPEADRRAGKPQLGLELAMREGRFEDIGWRVRKDGSRFWANVVITALHDRDGSVRGFAKVTRDITERRQEEERRTAALLEEARRLREHGQRMADLERSKSDFLNLASHELRGPLAVVRGYISMIEDGSLKPEDVANVAPLLSGKLTQMELLIKQMLETARLEHDSFELNRETFDLRKVARQQVHEFQSIAGKRVPLVVEAGESPVMVHGDRARIATVASNLIDNAIKYTLGTGTPVRVIVSSRDTHAFLTVEDHGIGIAPEHMDKIFKRFGRLDTEENRTVGGTGLGLFLSREIVRRHGGEILVESHPHSGSRFTMSLPLEARRQPA